MFSENYFSIFIGDDSKEDTPVPISNTVVKLLSADDTWWEAAWESRTLPVLRNRLRYLGLFFFALLFDWLLRPAASLLSGKR